MIQKIISTTAIASIMFTASAVASDYNNDGNADILFKQTNGNIKAWFMSATGKTGEVYYGQNKDIVAEGDFNGDGFRDMIVRQEDGTTSIWDNNGTGRTGRYLAGDNNWTVFGSGDFDNDGFDDILWREIDGSLAAWYMNASGKRERKYLAGRNSFVSVQDIADMNGDGNDDIFFQQPDGDFVFWTMDATGKTGSVLVSKDIGKKVEGLGDFDGNGYADILWRNEDGSTVIWFLDAAGPAGKTISNTITGPALSAWRIEDIEDYNNDGNADILFKKENGDLIIWFMSSIGKTGKLDVTENKGWTILPSADKIVKPEVALPLEIDSNLTLTSDKNWLIETGTTVSNNAVLTIEPGTIVAGYEGISDIASYLLVTQGCKIIAEGTTYQPILFTSVGVGLDGEEPGTSDWGGIAIVGKASSHNQEIVGDIFPDYVRAALTGAEYGVFDDNSGTFKHVIIENVGVETDGNVYLSDGLSLLGVGSATEISDVTLRYSNGEAVKIMNSTVNLTNITISDSWGADGGLFTAESGWTGMVDGLTITDSARYAAIKTNAPYATFKNVNITLDDHSRGLLYFGEVTAGGHFENMTLTDNKTNAYTGTIHASSYAYIDANTTFTNVTLKGTNSIDFTGPVDNPDILEQLFNAGTGNSIDKNISN